MNTQNTISDAAIRNRTGRGWEEWLEILDANEMVSRPHAAIARWLREEHDVDGWGSQAITVSYERARGLREVGENANGFSITATKTIAVPVEGLYDAWLHHARELPLREQTATRPKSARYDWEDGSTRVIVGFEAKGDAKSMIALAHERLPDAAEAERMKSFWRERVAALKQRLEP